ncbi:MAG: SEC-C metal-binding domain-containing protein [Acidobacteriota bacterium]
MATAAQIAANRKNAKASSGPKTIEGKARSSRNAQGLGLFSADNCVQPAEQEEYDALCKSLWEELNPVGAVEQMFATEIIRGAWRLRRCAAVEGTLAFWVDREARAAHIAKFGNDAQFEARDPLFYDVYADKQTRVDCARAQASGVVRRATAELRRLQTERLLRSTLLPARAAQSGFGLASLRELTPLLEGAEKKQLLEEYSGAGASTREPEPAPESEIINQSQSDTVETEEPAFAKPTRIAEMDALTPRNAPCPCGKGVKYKRCCGKDAPAVFGAAA